MSFESVFKDYIRIQMRRRSCIFVQARYRHVNDFVSLANQFDGFRSSSRNFAPENYRYPIIFYIVWSKIFQSVALDNKMEPMPW